MAVVVTHDHPPMNELVTNATGILVQPDHTGSYADQVGSLLWVSDCGEGEGQFSAVPVTQGLPAPGAQSSLFLLCMTTQQGLERAQQ
jgi:hypothetical protein